MSGNVKSIERLVAAFKFSDLQTAVTLWKWLEQNGKNIKDLEEYISSRTASKPSDTKFHTKGCPECNFRMIALPVNTNKCNQVGGDYKYQWLCNKCHYEEFVKEI